MPATISTAARPCWPPAEHPVSSPDTDSAALRLAAARVVAGVLGGRSLKTVLGPAEQALPDPRARASLHAIVMAAVRGSLRWRAAVARLLERPLPARARAVEAALVCALSQIEDLQAPAHAVVNDTVAAVRALGQPGLAGLANAVLRRWLRERETHLLALDHDEVAHSLHPAWLLRQLRTDWPGDWPAIVDAGNRPAPMWLRSNAAHIAREGYLAQLAAAGIVATVPDDSRLDQAVRLATPLPVGRLPGFADGLASVQDGAAQYAAALLEAAPGQTVLDACAAPGGKSAHILERCPDVASLVALDHDPARLSRVEAGIARLRLGTDRLRCVVGDAAEPAAWWDGARFDRILLDAPCSATGIGRRQPDVRLHRRAADVPVLAAGQARMLRALWPLLAPGGRLLYAVCSVLRAEGEAVVGTFVESQADARERKLDLPGARSLSVGVQLLPGTGDMDGFYYALLERC
ncbi:MAG: 16S rRNA (cytosine(967)-C(5))-methyltransferase RsmB [Xanthomonadales bacterium]|nr:16S rRNA (cytosine(967)-C(5))-methyltransferase RsmB [Xanthomonadales bacterium]